MKGRSLIEFNLTSEQLGKMFSPSNELTIKTWEKRWLDNIIENLRLHPQPRPLKDLMGQVTRHTALVCGSGWTLNKLKRHAHLVPPYWGLVVPDHSLIPVLELGLKPTVVCTMDGHQETEPHILDGFKLLRERHPDVPTVVDMTCCPSITELLTNPYFFRSCGDAKHIVVRYVQREAPQTDFIGHGGNVGSLCVILTKFFMFSRHVVFIGMNYSMYLGTKTTDYWHMRDMPETHTYLPVCDIYGRPTWTMANLHNYKWWLEHFCFVSDSQEFINSNDGGFLGVASPGENYNHFKYMTLDKAVEHLKGHDEFDD